MIVRYDSRVNGSRLRLGIVNCFTSRRPSPRLVVCPAMRTTRTFSGRHVSPAFGCSPNLGRGLRRKGRKHNTTGGSDAAVHVGRCTNKCVTLINTGSPTNLTSEPVQVLLTSRVSHCNIARRNSPLGLNVRHAAGFRGHGGIFISAPILRRADGVRG